MSSLTSSATVSTGFYLVCLLTIEDKRGINFFLAIANFEKFKKICSNMCDIYPYFQVPDRLKYQRHKYILLKCCCV